VNSLHSIAPCIGVLLVLGAAGRAQQSDNTQTINPLQPATAQFLEWENKGQPDVNGGGAGISVEGDFVVASGISGARA
jgi:hypothetical protein